MKFDFIIVFVLSWVFCNAQDSIAYKERTIEEVTVSGSLRPVSRFESTVPVEVYSAGFLKMNPSPAFYEALQFVNGIRPQNNCSICNTGDIHINGQEGANTLVLIDGIPVISGLASVYALNGIPSSIVEKIEILRGPASALYGSEATGGVLNIITKSSNRAPRIAVDVQATSWSEFNADVSGKVNMNEKNTLISSASYYLYNLPIDRNKDGFTDVTLQNRFAGFGKFQRQLKNDRKLLVTGRYNYEYRWGGEMDWKKQYRGTDFKYAESIETNRWEVGVDYELPLKEMIKIQASSSGHYQNSYYGLLSFNAVQHTAFAQGYWTKALPRNTLIAGLTYRMTQYNDNTVATENPKSKYTLNAHRVGIFLQDEIQMHKNHLLLIGLRLEHHPVHKAILSPRINYKWTSKSKNESIGISGGNGFRIVNVFTEDHAALSGSREVVFLSDLKPEQNWNAQIHANKKFITQNVTIETDVSAFYTYYTNKIVPNYTMDANKIIYDNLSGYAISRGVQLNLSLASDFGLRVMGGVSLLDAYAVENKIKQRQFFSERFSATWTISQRIKKWGVQIDYSGNVYSPMSLPLLSELDPRPALSPWYSIQNIQISKKCKYGIEVYAGVKNLLNFVPWKKIPFLIARSEDPFDKKVLYDTNGNIIATSENPYALSFDPGYIYAQNQGIRAFAGIRFELK